MDAQAAEQYAPQSQEGPGPVGEPYNPNAAFARALFAKQALDRRMWPGGGP